MTELIPSCCTLSPETQATVAIHTFSTSATSGAPSVTATNACDTTPARSLDIMVNTLPATPAITMPLAAGAGSPGHPASVAAHAGSIYAWSISSGEITSETGRCPSSTRPESSGLSRSLKLASDGNGTIGVETNAVGAAIHLILDVTGTFQKAGRLGAGGLRSLSVPRRSDLPGGSCR